MRSKLFICLFTIFFAAKLFADTTSVVPDTIIKPFATPNQGPLGIDNITGVALYGAAIFFAVLILMLWRRNIIIKR